jgi:hypothetical protein
MAVLNTSAVITKPIAPTSRHHSPSETRSTTPAMITATATVRCTAKLF